MFKLAKDSAVKPRTQAINQLKAVLVAADPALRGSLPGLPTTKLIRRCAALDTGTGAPTDTTSAAGVDPAAARPPDPRPHRRTR